MKEIVDEIQNWNEDIVYRREMQDNFWVGVFYPDIYYDFEGKLGKKPDDLEEVLCDMALAAPAICAYRSYEKELPGNVTMDEFICAPTQIGRKFIDRMNLPESIAVIDLNFSESSEDAYWKNVLK